MSRLQTLRRKKQVQLRQWWSGVSTAIILPQRIALQCPQRRIQGRPETGYQFDFITHRHSSEKYHPGTANRSKACDCKTFSAGHIFRIDLQDTGKIGNQIERLQSEKSQRKNEKGLSIST
ncbi:MAG: hypothetical protein HY938_09460 [Nitrosomonadales bacterium]|nr:hypothetical protein [Nitrosomonadales bacterium]